MRQAVAHRQWPGADKTFPARAKSKPFDRAPSRIRPVQNPDSLFMLRRCFENVTQGRNERVDAATDVLEIDQQNVETYPSSSLSAGALRRKD